MIKDKKAKNKIIKDKKASSTRALYRTSYNLGDKTATLNHSNIAISSLNSFMSDSLFSSSLTCGRHVTSTVQYIIMDKVLFKYRNIPSTTLSWPAPGAGIRLCRGRWPAFPDAGLFLSLIQEWLESAFE